MKLTFTFAHGEPITIDSQHLNEKHERRFRSVLGQPRDEQIGIIRREAIDVRMAADGWLDLLSRGSKTHTADEVRELGELADAIRELEYYVVNSDGELVVDVTS